MSGHVYRAYLLRLWQERNEGPWRATLEDPHRQRRYAFGTMEELIAFLEGATGEQLRPTRPTGTPADPDDEK